MILPPTLTITPSPWPTSTNTTFTGEEAAGCRPEYLTARLGMEHGEQGLSIFVTGGRLRSANMTRNAISPDELEKLADVS